MMGSLFLGDLILEPRASPGPPGCADAVRVPVLGLEAHRSWDQRVRSDLWTGLCRSCTEPLGDPPCALSFPQAEVTSSQAVSPAGSQDRIPRWPWTESQEALGSSQGRIPKQTWPHSAVCTGVSSWKKKKDGPRWSPFWHRERPLGGRCHVWTTLGPGGHGAAGGYRDPKAEAS